METLTKEYLYKLLKSHDWNFEYSDDFGVWDKGRNSLFKLKQTLQEAKEQPDLKKVIKEFYEEKSINQNTNLVYSILKDYF